MKISSTLAVTAFTWLEIKRARLRWFALAVLALGCCIGEFAATIAITETAQHRLVFYAASMRLVTVFVMALFVATSVMREINDKGLELALSRPISRGDWYLGKLLGYAAAVASMAILISIPVIIQVPLAGLVWCFSLMLELAIVIAAALAFAVTLRQITIALSLLAGFYILSRGIAGLALISRGSTVDLTLASNQVVAWMVEALAFVLPDLSRFTRADWLIGEFPNQLDIALLAGQSFVYVSFLAALGLFDLYRREF